MIFGTSIPEATGHQMAIQFPTSPTSAYTLHGENRTNEICTEMNNKRQQTGDYIT